MSYEVLSLSCSQLFLVLALIPLIYINLLYMPHQSPRLIHGIVLLKLTPFISERNGHQFDLLSRNKAEEVFLETVLILKA